MIWYYAQQNTRMGPVDDTAFQALVQSGVITAQTLVWNETLTQWTLYGQLMPSASLSQPTPAAPQENPVLPTDAAPCHECGKMFSKGDMLNYQNVWICANCKPLFVQKIREGAPLALSLEYAGFWIRWGAKLLDGLIQGAVFMVGGLLLGIVFASTGGSPDIGGMVWWLFQLLGILFSAFYNTFFVGKYAATPGKMICGLKVVTSDGGQVSYARAIGRHFAEMLNGFTLWIGYLIAAFDAEKRTLHDHICNTRVVKKWQ